MSAAAVARGCQVHAGVARPARFSFPPPARRRAECLWRFLSRKAREIRFCVDMPTNWKVYKKCDFWLQNRPCLARALKRLQPVAAGVTPEGAQPGTRDKGDAQADRSVNGMSREMDATALQEVARHTAELR